MNWKKMGVFILVAIILIGIFNVLFRYALPLKAARFTSGSMEPALSFGDVLFYSADEEYAVDDIIFYPSIRPMPVVMRIVAVNPDGTFQIKADANPIIIAELNHDSIEREKIIGKVRFHLSQHIFYPVLYGMVFLLSWLAMRWASQRWKLE